ncbi:MAG TPA: c-type cytochrome [Gemmatimonadales bacterium]
MNALVFMRVFIVVGALCAVEGARSALEAQDLVRGKELYDRWCAGCHGETGAGDGEAAAYMLPRPRDFTRAVYQVRTTANGELPTDDDLRRVIDEGMPGTAMPGWKARLRSRDRDAVVAYIKSFSRFFGDDAPTPLEFGRAPGETEAGVAEGARVFQQLECFKCHGDEGRGDGPSAPTMTDDWGFPIRPADLSRPWTFNGGSNVEDIYRRLRTGLDGTPMPSFSDVIEAGILTEDQLWRVAQYVRSLGTDEPVIREVIRAARTDAGLPSGPSDRAWDDVEPFYIPMVGQIVVAPRWFTPTVDGLWVRAVHDGERLAMQISWSDPSRSPDPAWQEWLERIAGSSMTADGPIEVMQGGDRLAVQFPVMLTEGMERPFFLGGDTRRRVYAWRWTSDGDRLEVGRGSGLTSFAGEPSDEVVHAAIWANGRWRLMLSRSLVPRDSAAAPPFTVGEAIPIAFQAGDGSSGELGARGSVSAWYAIYLGVPAPPTMLVLPVATALVTAVLGVAIVARAQRRAPHS